MTKRIAVLFSPDEAATIMELIRRERAQVRNTRQRPRTDLNLDPGQAPEVYLAVAPTGGIPANDRMGTTGTSSTDLQDDIPGSAECGVYRMHPGGWPEPVEGLTRTVYNLSTTAIDAGTPVLVVKDKWGAWFVAGVPGPTGAAGSGAITVQEVDGSPSYTTGTLRVPSGASILSNTGTTTTLAAASSTTGGLLTTGTQNIAGEKYFVGGLSTGSTTTRYLRVGFGNLTAYHTPDPDCQAQFLLTPNQDYTNVSNPSLYGVTGGSTAFIFLGFNTDGTVDPNPKLVIQDASSNYLAGQYGTLSDGSAVSGGLVTSVISHKMDGTAAPTVNDDTGDGYAVGSRWYDLTNDAEYVCLDATAGAAVWKKTTP